MRRLALVPITVFVLLVSGFPVASADAGSCTGLPATEPAPLCGTTTITGGSSGYVVVSAPDTGVTLEDANIHVEGQGDFVGMVITSDPPYLVAPDCGTTPQGVEIRLCPNNQLDVRGLAATGPGGERRFVSISDGFCEPSCGLAGAYRLYLLTDGGPATVTLSFPELTGSETLSPNHDVTYDARVPDPSAEPPDAPFYGAGFTATMPTPRCSSAW